MQSKIHVILITHEEIGTAFLHTVSAALGEIPLPTTVIAVSYSADPDQLVSKLHALMQKMQSVPGFLVLTDLLGSTPCNVAKNLCQEARRVRLITGLNLPMLIRVMNYSTLSLDELADKALSGGKDGITSYQWSCS